MVILSSKPLSEVHAKVIYACRNTYIIGHPVRKLTFEKRDLQVSGTSEWDDGVPCRLMHTKRSDESGCKF